ncbi:recombination-associated protein RdgC [Aliidiomarina haloalkalitolerans]|uniref:Recombination-associated protein RdgC n=1 Tax=Aliidiomarina haloalkalitolerans TaxID=859059 RepID=A0A432VTQ7_9GAMM|nr:recombination-associated protein RdgC [Aliidiomarina haloalkalitolerans]MCL4409432.1 recombination-associated protein RdgC [Gammaproteobacteria bacterium]RUO19865.1 recombination-associated protein RdgC [Aliidiomarina haloalkalitolerans]
MWFKNLRIYQFTQPFTWSDEAEKLLEERRFTPCARHEPMSFGWVSPLNDEDAPLVHQIGKHVLLCARKEEKVMPASAVQMELESLREQFQQEHARPMPRKDLQAAKEDIVQRLLPQALSRHSIIWLMLDFDAQRVLVDASSATRAEEVTALLRSCLGSLPIRPWGPETNGSVFFTQWLAEQAAPTPFYLGTDAELRGQGEAESVARLKDHDLTSPEIALHLEHGKQCTQLGLDWDERVSFVLTDDYAIKRIRFLDVVKDARDADDTETRAEQLDADFALMSQEFQLMLNQLYAILALPDANVTGE